MTRDYPIPKSLFSRLINPLIFTVWGVQLLLAVIWHSKAPDGKPFIQSLALYLCPLAMIFFGVEWFREIRTSLTLQVEDEKITVQRKRGSRTLPAQPVVTVTDDLRHFYLFTRKEDIPLPKKNLPEDLAALLSDQIEEVK